MEEKIPMTPVASSSTTVNETKPQRKLQNTLLPHSTGKHRVDDEIYIYYETFILPDSQITCEEGPLEMEKVRLVAIQGFAAGADAWQPMLLEMKELWGRQADKATVLEVLCIENRGLGKSSSPKKKSQYSTTILAGDVLSVMDHVRWGSAHICGFSMGGMVATKLAALAPDRVVSLICMSVTGGGTQALPRSWRAFKFAVKGLLAKTALDRAYVDIKFHFSKHILRHKLCELVPPRLVKDVLLEEYRENHERVGAQPKEGFRGQLHAVLQHEVTKANIERIKSGKMPRKWRS
ncbi:Alpha/Beta hydrolase protein [Dunaliella salina]|uniref:Alpha/Beta hydrolase protein n=1 Tax=Dunaliella salina TaxID=3046 RepID=A0ABQ7GY95_DUNSA|nr:Alpha/Beta hydrolase protein [Dunaliella salina]|eukprot:KAF5839574.1 Alpha/Beta hydrolase protein [Dunaliella salina]